MYWGKYGSTEHSKGNKTVPEKIEYQNKHYDRPKGRRNIGRPKKRWRDQLHLED